MELTKNRGQTTNHQNGMFMLAQLRRKPFVGGRKVRTYQLFLERCSEDPSKHNRLQQPTEIYLVVQHIPNMSSCLWRNTSNMFLVTANQKSKMFVRKKINIACHEIPAICKAVQLNFWFTALGQVMDKWHPTWRNSPCIMITIWCSHEHL